MKSKLLRNTLAAALLWGAALIPATGQGSLDPPGPPAPTQKSLQQIWDKLVSIEADLAALQNNGTDVVQSLDDLAAQVTSVAARIDSSALASDSRTALLTEVAAALGVDLPWHPRRIFDDADAGRESSLGYSPQGHPAIAHLRPHFIGIGDGPGDLLLTEFDGSEWFTTKVDSEVNYSTSLKFDHAGNVAIAYFKQARLRFATRVGGVWQLTTVDPAQHYFGAPSLAYDREGNPGISYVTADDELKLAYRTGAAWELGTVIQESNGALSSNGSVGLPPSLAFDAGGLPSIAYATMLHEGLADPEPTEVKLKYARFDGAAWNAEVVEADPDAADASLALAPDGTAHIAYRQADKLVIAKRGSFGGWSKSVAVASHPTGSRFPIAFTPSGNPAVVYADWQAETIVYTVLEGAEWDYQTARSPGLFPYDLSLAFAPDGQPGISYTVVEDGNVGGGLLYTHRGVNP